MTAAGARMSAVPRVRMSRGTATSVLALTAVAAVVYWPRVVHGGFAWDDWWNGAAAATTLGQGFVGPFNVGELVYEPGIALVLPLPHLVFGDAAGWHLALAVGLGVALSLSLVGLVRELGVPALSALLIGVLALVFPWADANRLWATAGINQLAPILYFAGATVAVRRLPGRARLSLLLYVASMLTYAATVPAVALSPLLYRCRMPWREAWRRGRRDVAAAAAVAVYVSVTSPKPVQHLGGQVRHAQTIADQWLTLVARSLAPGAGVGRWGVLACLAAVLAAASVAFRAGRRRLLVWLALAGYGAAFSFASYVFYAPGAPKYEPLAQGLYNRVGLVPAAAVAALVVGVAGLVAQGVAGRRRGAAAAVAALLSVAVAAGWSVLVRHDIHRWNTATVEARDVLAALDRGLPPLAPHSTVYTTGHPRSLAPGVPVFDSSFDLSNAIRTVRRDSTIRASPLVGPLDCGTTAALPTRPLPYPLPPARYGLLFVMDRSGVVVRVDSRAACAAVDRRLFPRPATVRVSGEAAIASRAARP
jgi:hypothetical protein